MSAACRANGTTHVGPPCAERVVSNLRVSRGGGTAKYARSDKEVIATVAYMVNSDRVRLCGNFKGARFDLDALTDDVAA